MKRLICILLFLFVLKGLSIQAFSQTPEKKFDKILSTQNYESSPGFAVLVAKNDQVIYRKAYGYANLELEVPLKPDHIFRIASITKQFTACAILKLEEEGKLSLQDDITKFIEDYPTGGHEITIEHLLTHTSGIKNYTSSKEWNAEMSKKDFTPQEMIEFIKNAPPDFAPGEKYKYNNSAYFILGHIIEIVSEKSYEEYLNETFFTPLGMKNTLYGNTSRIVKNRVSGYHKKDDGFTNADYVSMTHTYAAGGLLSNAEDLFTWYEAVMSDKVISKENRLKAHTSYKLNSRKPTGYGFGWHLGNIQGKPMIHHGGGISGFSAYSLYIPEEKVFVAVLSNCDGLSSRSMAYKLAGIAVNKPFDRKEVPVNKEMLHDYVGVFVSEEKEERSIIIENDSLMHVHPSGNRFRMIPFDKDRFFAQNSFNVYSFERNQKNEVISLEIRGTAYQPGIYLKTDKPLNVKGEIKLPESVLEKYTGEYELMPDFIITISKKGNKMFAKTSKQPEFEIAAYEENKFFSKEFPLEFVFHAEETGNATKLIIIQGDEYEAKRIH